MPTPSGLKISQLPTGIAPSKTDLLVSVQNGNTVQVPVSSVRLNYTSELPESGNLYYTDARARAALSGSNGIFYSNTEGTISIDGGLFTQIDTAYKNTITDINIVDEGRKKTIIFSFIDGTKKGGSWIDIGQDIAIDATHGLAYTFDTNNRYILANTDRGSDQNIFKNISVSGSNTIIASQNNDAIQFIPGDNISISSDKTNKRITISAAAAANPVTGVSAVSGVSATRVGGFVTIVNNDKGTSQNIFKNVAVSGLSTIVATGNNDTLNIIAGSNITFSTDPTTNRLVINAVSGAGLVGNVQSVNGLSGVVLLTTDNIPESINKYFTTQRARESFYAGSGIAIDNGVITNLSPGSGIAKFDTIHVTKRTSPSSQQEMGTLYGSGSRIINLIGGSGITITPLLNPGQGEQYTNYLTIDATPLGYGPTGSIQYNKNGILYGANTFGYNPNTEIVSGITFLATPYSYATGIIIKQNSVASTPVMQAFTDKNNNLLSYFGASGQFIGPVCPSIISTETNITLNNTHNGKTFLTTGNDWSTGQYFTLDPGISVSGWNIKIVQGNASQAVINTNAGVYIQKPSDRYSRTRTVNSVVEILKLNDNSFVLYGDLDIVGGAVSVGGGTSTGGGGTTTTGGGTTITGGGTVDPPSTTVIGGGGTDCTLVGAAIPKANLNIQPQYGTINVIELYNSKTAYPGGAKDNFINVVPNVVNTGNYVYNAWGTAGISIPIKKATVEIKLPASRSCYSLVTVQDQFGNIEDYSNKPNSAIKVNVFASDNENTKSYEDFPIRICTKANSINAPIVTGDFRIAVAHDSTNLYRGVRGYRNDEYNTTVDPIFIYKSENCIDNLSSQILNLAAYNNTVVAKIPDELKDWSNGVYSARTLLYNKKPSDTGNILYKSNDLNGYSSIVLNRSGGNGVISGCLQADFPPDKSFGYSGSLSQFDYIDAQTFIQYRNYYQDIYGTVIFVVVSLDNSDSNGDTILDICSDNTSHITLAKGNYANSLDGIIYLKVDGYTLPANISDPSTVKMYLNNSTTPHGQLDIPTSPSNKWVIYTIELGPLNAGLYGSTFSNIYNKLVVGESITSSLPMKGKVAEISAFAVGMHRMSQVRLDVSPAQTVKTIDYDRNIYLTFKTDMQNYLMKKYNIS